MTPETIFRKWIWIASCVVIFTACVKEPSGLPKHPEPDNLNDTVLLNVPYGEDARQVYDIHLPAKRDSGTPVVVMIHGGAWKEGKKEDFDTYINIIKKKWNDVAIVNMNYRLASNANDIHHDEMMSDISSVISKVSTNKSTYHISSKIGVVGASAGGQLAMIYAYRYNPDIKCVGDFFGPAIINDWSWYDSYNLWLGAKVGDILAEYVGRKWDTTAYKAVSPYWNISGTSQPTIIFHGSLDPIVPVYQSQWLHNKLNGLAVTSEYHEYVAFHGLDNTQSDDAIDKLIAFFKVHIH